MAPLGEHNASLTTRVFPKFCLAIAFLAQQEGRKCVKRRVAKEEFVEAMWRSFGEASLFATISLQKKMTMQAAMESNYPAVQCFLEALVGSLTAVTAEGDLLLGDQSFESLKNGA